ncbi:MAG: hypothetical protein EAX86_13325 [Candidatus Heimdallarchaeota archaeon]|nr:hypothetical protein [Candidatus Heimdallarchaeota archaeon]
MTDMGPYPLLNISPISEDTTVKLSVIGMTILSMGAGTVAEKQHYRLHGSIPIPDSPDLEALAMSFTVSPIKTKDVRIDEYGRESTVWLIFRSSDRNKIFRLHSSIEKELKEATIGIKAEQDLSDPAIMRPILDKMKNLPQELDEEAEIVEEPYYIPEKAGLSFYTIDEEGELISLEPSDDLTPYSVLILVNGVVKRIFVIKLRDERLQKLMFLAGSCASSLNSTRFKNEFTIRDVTDPLEREMILEKLGIIREISM